MRSAHVLIWAAARHRRGAIIRADVDNNLDVARKMHLAQQKRFQSICSPAKLIAPYDAFFADCDFNDLFKNTKDHRRP